MHDPDPPDEIRLTCHGCLLACPNTGDETRPDGARGQIPVSGGIIAEAERYAPGDAGCSAVVAAVVREASCFRRLRYCAAPKGRPAR